MAKFAPDGRLVYSTFLGGTAPSNGEGIAVDDSGAAYVTGNVGTGAFPTTRDAFQTRNKGGGNDVFVVKLSSDGQHLLYATLLGGRGVDRSAGIAVDARGSAYVTGRTESRDFPTTPDAAQRTYVRGQEDAFVAKLSADGHRLVYATFLGGGDFNEATSIAVDDRGDAYVTGGAGAHGFPTIRGVVQPRAPSANGGAFVTKVSPSGQQLLYSTYLAGTGANGPDVGLGIALDRTGAAYITGRAGSPDFPITRKAYQTMYKAKNDNTVFVAKLSSNGQHVVYATFLGGSGLQEAHGITVDGTGAAYVTGGTTSGDFPVTQGTIRTGYRGNEDAFVSKLSPNGRRLLYSTLLNGAALDEGNGIAVDAAGRACVTGDTGSSDFPTTRGSLLPAFTGGLSVAFVSKLRPDGKGLMFSTFLGGTT